MLRLEEEKKKNLAEDIEKTSVKIKDVEKSYSVIEIKEK